MIFAELIAKINQLFGYTPTQAQLLANPDLLEIAIDACGVNVNSLTDIADSLNTLLGTAYTAAQLTSRPDLIRLGLKSLQANLPNGTRLNNVEIFVQITPPLTRTDGSLLQNGDTWIKPIDNGIFNSAGRYVWNNSVSLWVTEQKRFMAGGYNATVNNTSFNAALVENGYLCGFTEISTNIDRTTDFPQFANLYVSAWTWRVYSTVLTTNFDTNNRFDLRANVVNSTSSAGALITTVNSDSVLTQGGTVAYFPLSSVINRNANQAISASVRIKNVVGAPAYGSGILRPIWSYVIQGVHP
jgi:hypothetical protein